MLRILLISIITSCSLSAMEKNPIRIELETLLDVERAHPGFIAKNIASDLKNIRNDQYVRYFSVNASSIASSKAQSTGEPNTRAIN